MSVLKAKRGISKAEFVNTANKIYTETLWFLSRLSARYSRLLATDTIHLAHEIIANAEKANTMQPVDQVRFELREKYFLSAKAALGALDVQLAHIYNLLMLNPEGAFDNKDKSGAIQKLDKMAEKLGCLIDDEAKLLAGVLKSDKQTFAKKTKS
ncbi:MAG: hypothetical protein IJ685_04565 [Selenomonadaceae bacterium]|nr:hypothetical protein [Selenomonadaceae bacterium]